MSEPSYDAVLGDLRIAYDARVAERESESLPPWKIVVRQRFLERLQRAHARTLLEIGAGPGIHGQFFAEAGLDVRCTDLSPAMVAACRARGLEASVQDFLCLSVDQPVDAVFAMNCLLHVPPADMPRVLERVRGLLGPGGLFYLGQYGGIDRAAAWPEDHYDPPRFFSYLSDTRIRSFCAAAGFVEDEFRAVDIGTTRKLAPEVHFQSITLVAG